MVKPKPVNTTACLLAFGCTFAVLGQATARASAPPRRICSAVQAADEILLDLVPMQRIVCVNEWVDKTAETKGRFPARITRIHSSVEKVLAARPDLVIAPPFQFGLAFIQSLQKARLPVVSYGYWKSFADIASGITTLGKLVGEEKKAALLRKGFETQLAQVSRQAACEKTRPWVLDYSGGWSPGADTTLNDLITAAGGRNAGAAMGLKGWVEVSMEKVLRQDPDVIFTGDSAARELTATPLLKSTRAFRTGRFYSLQGAPVGSISPSVVRAVRALAVKLHPKCFRK